LCREVLIAGDERLETGLFGSVEQIAIGQTTPTHLGGGSDVLRRQNAADPDRGVLVEQESSSVRGWADPGKAQNPFYALEGHALVDFGRDLLGREAVPCIIEDGLGRNARALYQPRRRKADPGRSQHPGIVTSQSLLASDASFQISREVYGDSAWNWKRLQKYSRELN
jgi:hypothetical protein